MDFNISQKCYTTPVLYDLDLYLPRKSYKTGFTVLASYDEKLNQLLLQKH